MTAGQTSNLHAKMQHIWKVWIWDSFSANKKSNIHQNRGNYLL